MQNWEAEGNQALATPGEALDSAMPEAITCTLSKT